MSRKSKMEMEHSSIAPDRAPACSSSTNGNNINEILQAAIVLEGFQGIFKNAERLQITIDPAIYFENETNASTFELWDSQNEFTEVSLADRNSPDVGTSKGIAASQEIQEVSKDAEFMQISIDPAMFFQNETSTSTAQVSDSQAECVASSETNSPDVEKTEEIDEGGAIQQGATPDIGVQRADRQILKSNGMVKIRVVGPAETSTGSPQPFVPRSLQIKIIRIINKSHDDEDLANDNAVFLPSVAEDRNSGTNRRKTKACYKRGQTTRRLKRMTNCKRIRFEKREHKCDHCGKSFTRFSSLNRHKLIHSGERPSYQCDQCSQSFLNLFNLKRHKRIHSNVEGENVHLQHHALERPGSSVQCEKEAADSTHSTADKRIHAGDETYTCDQCSKSFGRKAQLLSHQRIAHTKPHPEGYSQANVSTAVIEKDFKNLAATKRILSGERTNKSEDHNKSSTESSNLKTQKRKTVRRNKSRFVQQLSDSTAPETTHPKGRPFKCDQCNKFYISSYRLKRHKIIHSSGKPHKCDQCEKAYAQLGNLTVHKRMHSSKTRFECDQCHKSYSDASNLSRHKRLHSSDNPFKCDHCDKFFRSSHYLKRHQMTHSTEKPFKCDQCEKTFTFSESLKRHKLLYCGDRPFQCDQCYQSFTASSKLESHKLIHSGERPHECETCSKSFFTLQHLNSHRKVHSEENPHKCDQCNKSFTSGATLKRHKETHSEERSYTCETCSKSFVTLHFLKIHRQIHAQDRRRFVCDRCGKAYVKLLSLKAHVRTHTGEKPFMCDQCGRGFTHVSSLISHKLIHSIEKPYKCDQCSKSFTQLSHLKVHKRTHTGEKPFKCDQCDKAYSQLHVLISHKRTHTGERPYKCDQCEKAFASVDILTSHKRTHTGEKPYKCEYCDKAFTRSLNLTTHRRTHTGEKPYNCDQCDKSFAVSAVFKRHQRRHYLPDRRFKKLQPGNQVLDSIIEGFELEGPPGPSVNSFQ